MSQTLRSTHLPASPGLQEKTGGQFSDNLKDSFFFFPDVGHLKVFIEFVTIFLMLWFFGLLNLLQYCFCFLFCFFGHEVCGISASDQGSNLYPVHWKARS